jgi:hypothetical protein
MSKQSTLDLFDTELFTTEIEKLSAIWDSILAYRSKQDKTYALEVLCKKFIENPFPFINSLVQQCKPENFIL